jgi:hypothetical protein
MAGAEGKRNQSIEGIEWVQKLVKLEPQNRVLGNTRDAGIRIHFWN